MKALGKALWAAAAAWALLGLKSAQVGVSARKMGALRVPDAPGIQGPLQEMVDSLEAEIARRADYQVDSLPDPLALGAVVRAAKPAGPRDEFTEALRQMRLSCTIVSPRGATAILKFRGKSWVVAVGDTLGGRTVKAIGQKAVTLDDHGREVTLVNQPAPEGEFHKAAEDAVEEMRL